jgi:hypothetical protein
MQLITNQKEMNRDLMMKLQAKYLPIQTRQAIDK